MGAEKTPRSLQQRHRRWLQENAMNCRVKHPTASGIGARGIIGGLDDEVLLQDSGVSTNGSHRDLIRACGRDLLLRCQMLLESWLYCVHHGLGRCLFGGGVGDLGGRCHAHTGGRGMWDVEGGGWGSSVDYLPG